MVIAGVKSMHSVRIPSLEELHRLHPPQRLHPARSKFLHSLGLQPPPRSALAAQPRSCSWRPREMPWEEGPWACDTPADAFRSTSDLALSMTFSAADDGQLAAGVAKAPRVRGRRGRSAFGERRGADLAPSETVASLLCARSPSDLPPQHRPAATRQANASVLSRLEGGASIDELCLKSLIRRERRLATSTRQMLDTTLAARGGTAGLPDRASPRFVRSPRAENVLFLSGEAHGGVSLAPIRISADGRATQGAGPAAASSVSRAACWHVDARGRTSLGLGGGRSPIGPT